jgi:ATP-dependent Clp protease ATP-binding subunit ClpB
LQFLRAADIRADGKPISLGHLEQELRTTTEDYGADFTRIENGRKASAVVRDSVARAESPMRNVPKLTDQFPTIASIGIDLTVQASKKPFDRAVGRNDEIDHVIQTLGMRDTPSMTLIGDSGVGKTAILKELANRSASAIPEEQLPAELRDAHFVALKSSVLREAFNKDPQLLTKLAHEQGVAAKAGTPVVYVIDESATLSPAMVEPLKDVLRKGDGDNLRAIFATTEEEWEKGPPAGGGIVWGKDRALRNRAPSYKVGEPPKDVALQMAMANRKAYAEYHGVQIDPGGVAAAIELSRYKKDMPLPSSATFLIDRAASMVKQQLRENPIELRRLNYDIQDIQKALNETELSDDVDSKKARQTLENRLAELLKTHEQVSKDVQAERTVQTELFAALADSVKREKALQETPEGSAAYPKLVEEVNELKGRVEQLKSKLAALPRRYFNLSVDRRAVAEAVSQDTGKKVSELEVGDFAQYRNLEKDWDSRVKGQPKAKKLYADLIRADRLGLHPKGEAIGMVHLAGPTGVGKTTLAQAVSDTQFQGHHIYVDCTELKQPHELLRLFGAPPSYVGHDEGSRLADDVERFGGVAHIVFDDADKANRELFTRLMQVKEQGGLRDSKGKWVSFEKVLITFTSNFATAKLAPLIQGDGTYTDEAEAMEVVKREFLTETGKPELWKRIDTVVADPLSPAMAAGIAELKTKELTRMFESAQDVHVHFTGAANAEKPQLTGAMKWLLDHGFDPIYGGRNLKILLRDSAQNPLQDLLMNEKIKKGDYVTVDVAADGSRLEFRPMTKEERAQYGAAK